VPVAEQVIAARIRRAGVEALSQVRVRWFLKKQKRKKTIKDPETGKPKVVTRTVVVERSKPGEYPRADTGLLSKSIFSEVKRVGRYSYKGYVGTPLDYGLILEWTLNRSFLLRTYMEEENNLIRLLTKRTGTGGRSGGKRGGGRGSTRGKGGGKKGGK